MQEGENSTKVTIDACEGCQYKNSSLTCPLLKLFSNRLGVTLGTKEGETKLEVGEWGRSFNVEKPLPDVYERLEWTPFDRDARLLRRLDLMRRYVFWGPIPAGTTNFAGRAYCSYKDVAVDFCAKSNSDRPVVEDI